MPSVNEPTRIPASAKIQRLKRRFSCLNESVNDGTDRMTWTFRHFGVTGRLNRSGRRRTRLGSGQRSKTVSASTRGRSERVPRGKDKSPFEVASSSGYLRFPAVSNPELVTWVRTTMAGSAAGP